MTAVDRKHIMSSNQRLLRQIHRDVFAGAERAWIRIYSSYCKQHGDLNKDTIMQFKYQGEVFKLEEDVQLRSGIKPLHPELVADFEEAYKMFVTDMEYEKRILKNMMAHAIRIAKYSEDLIELLPSVLHDSIYEAGFFQASDKPLMSVEQEEAFKKTYEEYFSLFDLRFTLGSVM